WVPQVLQRNDGITPAFAAGPAAPAEKAEDRRTRSRGALEQGHGLDVRRVREHVDRPRAHELVAVLLAQPPRVAGERRRVAGDVDEPGRRRLPHALQRLAGEA